MKKSLFCSTFDIKSWTCFDNTTFLCQWMNFYTQLVTRTIDHFIEMVTLGFFDPLSFLSPLWYLHFLVNFINFFWRQMENFDWIFELFFCYCIKANRITYQIVYRVRFTVSSSIALNWCPLENPSNKKEIECMDIEREGGKQVISIHMWHLGKNSLKKCTINHVQ